MIFGAANDKGLTVEIDPVTFVPKMVVVAADDPRVLVHDAHQQDPTLHRLLALMDKENDLPVALGVIRDIEAESYDEAVNKQISEVHEKAKAKTFDELTATLDTFLL